MNDFSEAEVEAAARAIIPFLRYVAGPDFYRVIARAALKAVATVRWQPIITAPKDESRILAFFSDPYPFMQILPARGAWWRINPCREIIPTHWMPLPAPPSQDRKEVMSNERQGRPIQRELLEPGYDTPPRESPGGGRFAGHIPGSYKRDYENPASNLAAENERLRAALAEADLKIKISKDVAERVAKALSISVGVTLTHAREVHRQILEAALEFDDAIKNLRRG
jgi:hypothetical protein